MIIGLTGGLAAGKGEVSNYLKEKGFGYYSLSNIVRETAQERGLEMTRKNLQDLGNKLREENGNGVLANIILSKFEDVIGNTVIDSIRNPGEVDVFRKLENFYLISVTARIELRAQRFIARDRKTDPRTYEDFIIADSRDKGLGEKNSGQAVEKCMQLADYTLINDGSLEDFRNKVEIIYNEISKK